MSESFKDQLSGWCSECGQYLQRENYFTQPLLNSDGTRHSHSMPWKLVSKRNLKRKRRGE